ncbi:MAG TPA: ATP-binding protein [Vicinamibacteria bacterium]|nr:ATP-binding protein [Vicinamibacteria bacterium]
MTPRPFRLTFALVAGLLSLLEAVGLVRTLGSQTSLREAFLRRTRTAVETARPRLEAVLRPGGTSAWAAAAREALAYSLASEVELFDPGGRRLFASPRPSPVEHWPDALPAGAGAPRSFGPFFGPASRILTYATFESAEGPVILRLSSPAAELVEDLRERRPVLLGHGLAMALLLLLAGLSLLPGRQAEPAPPPLVLGAYEAAMERLRDHGKALSREHATELRQLEDRVRDQEAMARAGELTAGMVHEVRNGLATVAGYARLIERSAASPEVADAARGVREECATLEAVIRRFMDFVKRETLNLASFDLGRLLTRVVGRESQSRPGARVSLDCPPDLLITADEELLERAFENLVRNGREAAGEAGQVSVTARREDGAVAVAVADDGPGFPPDARAGLRPFFTTKPGGLGLGLPLTLKIVGLHRGELAFADRRPRGLEAVVRLPVEGPSRKESGSSAGA